MSTTPDREWLRSKFFYFIKARRKEFFGMRLGDLSRHFIQKNQFFYFIRSPPAALKKTLFFAALLFFFERSGGEPMSTAGGDSLPK
jgi:hypothetical protein